jgi:ankyrin repeat protein
MESIKPQTPLGTTNVTAGDTLPEKIIKSLWNHLENGCSYPTLLQFFLNYWPDLIVSSDLFPAAISILAMAKNNSVEAENVTVEHFKQVLVDLIQENQQVVDIEHPVEESFLYYFNELLHNANPNVCIDLAQKGRDYLTKQPLGSIRCDVYHQPQLLVDYDTVSSISHNLSKKDALSLGSTCKIFYLNCRATLDIHSWKFESIEDGEKFKVADELCRKANKKLPDPKKSLAYFAKLTGNADQGKTAFFEYLVTDCVDLYLYLRKNPQRINDQDQYQNTLLHYAAEFMKPETAILIQQLLFSELGIDPEIKNHAHNTPFHIVCSYSKNSTEASFQYFANEVLSRGFDCSAKGHNGQTIFHSLVVTDSYGLSLKFLLRLMDKHELPNRKSTLDALRDKGSAAFYMCIQLGYAHAALALFKAGADPEAGSEDGTHNPLEIMVEDMIGARRRGAYSVWSKKWGELEKLLGDKLTPYLKAAESEPPTGDADCIIS